MIENEADRTQIEQLIKENLDGGDSQQAEAIQQLKMLYEQMGEEAFKKYIREQTGEDLPDELLELLRAGG